jgi:hypothetical protein
MDIYSDPTPIATAEQFKAALLSVRDKVGYSEKDRAMLREHCRAPNHMLSPDALAKKVGYPNGDTVNLHYGKLAGHIAGALHVTLPPTPGGDPHWWRTLAYGKDGTSDFDDGRYQWIMRPQLVQVLQEWRWA